MNRMILSFSLLIALAGAACTERSETPTAETTPPAATTPPVAEAEHSMTGCLREGAEAGKFRLTDLESGPATVEIAESTANLTPHVSHKVEITGSRVTGADPQAHSMKVTAVRMVSSTCP